MRKKQKKFLVNKKIIFVLLVFLIIFLIQKSMSKYVIEDQDAHSYESTAFYFESEIADVDDGKTYTISEWDGKSRTINFSVKNYINNLLITNEEITYKITAKLVDDSGNELSSDAIKIAILNGTGEEVTEDTVCKFASSGQLQETNYMLKIEPQSTLEKDTKVNVKLVISAKTPYTKDLIANISLVTNEKTPYEATLTNSSNGEYVTLNLKINTSQDITIAYDNTKLILDESQSLVSNLQSKSENSFTITKENLEEGNTYQINFIKIKSGVDITLGSDVIIK